MKAPSRLLAAIAVVSGLGSAYADQVSDVAGRSSAGRSVVSNFSAAHSATNVAAVPPQAGHRRLRPETEPGRHARPTTESSDAARAVPVAASNGIISLAAADDTGAIAAAQRPAPSAVSALAKTPGAPQETQLPASWITLLCGLVVMAFMATRGGSDPD